MSLLDQLIADPLFWSAVTARILVFIFFDRPLSDGYHVTERDSILDWEESYVIFAALTEVYILSWVTTLITQSGQTIVPFLRFDLWTVVMGVLVGLRWFVPWFRTLQDVDTNSPQAITRLGGFYTAVLFGTGFGITIAIALHPDAATLQLLFQRQVNLSITILEQFQAILGLQIPIIQPVIDKTVAIYINNAQLAIRAGIIGFIGGLALGLFVPLILVVGMNAAILFGVFTGLLIRNSIAIGQGLFAPPIAYLSSMGLLVAGHTFHEFMALLLIGVGAGFIGLGIVKQVTDPSKAGAIVVVAGFVQLAFAAFVEVWVDPRFINFLKGYITIEPSIVPLSVKSNWAVGAGSLLATTVLMVVVTAWMIRTTVTTIEDVL